MQKDALAQVNEDLVKETIRRYRLASEHEAVNLALRTLLGDAEYSPADDDYDEFSDLAALHPRRSSNGS
jgi:Arc/MetJ family transcription regulator